MNFHIENDRPGMTVYPELKDEATNQPIQGSSMVVDSRVANLAKDELNFDGQSPETFEDVTPLTEEELIDADADYTPSDISPVELAEISDEIHSSPVVISEDVANQIVSAPMGDSAADTTVTYLAHKVYQGDITAEEAFSEAISSGLPPEALAESFNRLKSFIN